MPESLTPLNDQLSVLKAEEKAAHERSQTATAAIKESWILSRDLLNPWTDTLRQNVEPTSDQLKTWTSDLLAQVAERGLVLTLDPLQTGHSALVVRDPAIQAEATAAQYAAGQARSTRIAFEAKHQAEMKAERDYAKAQGLKSAVERGESLTEIREALAT